MKDRQKARREAALRSGARRFGLLAIVAAAVGIVAPPSAASAFTYTAGTAEVVSDGGTDPTLSFTARPGEQNAVTVTLAGANYEVTDSNPVTAGTGCVQADPMKASCAADDIKDIRVSLRGGDDSVILETPIKATVFGGPGADTIDTRDGVADQVACGDGADATATVDPIDGVFPDCEAVDDGDPPETTIDSASGPPDVTTDTSARFSFASNDDTATFECSLDGGNFAPCTPSTTYTDLRAGPHDFLVRAIDHAGNGLADATPAERTWTVVAQAPPPASPTVQVLPFVTPSGKRLPESLVLIAGRAIKVTKHRLVSVALNCSGTRDCAGRVTLATAKKVRYARKRKRIVRLASREFEIQAGRTAKVRVRISRRKMRLLRRLRHLEVDVTVRDRDRAGRTRIGTRTIVLKAAR